MTDPERYALACALARSGRAGEPFGVWLAGDRLRVRYGLQGDPQPMSWPLAELAVEGSLRRRSGGGVRGRA